jgi:hypothetical protein
MKLIILILCKFLNLHKWAEYCSFRWKDDEDLRYCNRCGREEYISAVDYFPSGIGGTIWEEINKDIKKEYLTDI